MSLEMMVYLSSVFDSLGTCLGVFWLLSCIVLILALFFYFIEYGDRAKNLPFVKVALCWALAITIVGSLIPGEATMNKILAIRIAKQTPIVRLTLKVMNWLECRTDKAMAEVPDNKQAGEE